MNEVLIRVENGVGRLTLNRPAALHALTRDMCREMIRALIAWQDDPAVRLVMIDHSEGRGFCAGGDVRWLYDSIQAADGQALDFFFVEYQLDHLLFAYAKPTLAFMDGLVMGGGSGIAMPCRFRIATERTVFAMPETGIGLFPDVGGSWFLSRLPSHAGLRLALTGARARAADCLLLGLASHFVKADDLGALKAAILAAPEQLEALLARFKADPGAPEFPAIESRVQRAFSAASVEAILLALEREGDWGSEQAQTILSKSPFLSKIAVRQLQEGAGKTDFAEVMAMEFRMVSRVIVAHDFAEGVRAVIIDKDNRPGWRPGSLAEVTEGMVDAVFAPVPPQQAWRPLAQAREMERAT